MAHLGHHQGDGPDVVGWIRAVVMETGDDLATVATGLGVDRAWIAEILVGEPGEVDPVQVARMCAALESAAEELFGPGGAEPASPTSKG